MPQGYVRLQYESIPGNETNTPVVSTKKLFVPATSVSPKYATKHMGRDDEIRNQDEPLPVIPEAYDPGFGIKSRAYPDYLGWVLKWILGPPVTTAGDGIITDPDTVAIPVGVWKHVYAAPYSTPAGASPLTCQADIAYSDQGTYFKQKGVALSEVSIESPESGGVQVEASGLGLFMDRIANPALTPAYEALSVHPFKRGNLSLPTFLAGTGTHEDFGLKIASGIETVRSLGIASKFPDVMEKDNEGPITVMATLRQRQLDPDDINAMVSATGFAVKARWVNDVNVGATSYPYKLFVEMSNAQMVEGEPDDLENRRRHGAEFQIKSTTPTTGSTTISLFNSTATYV